MIPAIIVLCLFVVAAFAALVYVGWQIVKDFKENFR